MTSLNEVEVDIGVFKLQRTLILSNNINCVVENIMNTKQLSFEGLFFIDKKYNRWKIRSPFYNRAREIWGNTNHRFYRFVELRKDYNLLHEYLMYFTQDCDMFNEFEMRIKNLANHILSVYLGKFVLKNEIKTTVPYYLSKIIYKLHGDFIKDKIKTNINKIGMTLLETDTKLICFMVNHYEESLKKDKMNEDIIDVVQDIDLDMDIVNDVPMEGY
jgi:hypothetical protein